MTELVSTTVAAATVIGTAAASTLVPGVDADALVGAVAGGALFVTSARDLPLTSRLVYLFVSAGAGYVAVPEILSRVPLHSSGLAAFAAASLAVTVTTQLIERAKAFDITSLIPKRGA